MVLVPLIRAPPFIGESSRIDGAHPIPVLSAVQGGGDPLRAAVLPNRILEVAPHPFAQWLLWEEQANFAGFRTTTDPVAIEVAAVPRP